MVYEIKISGPAEKQLSKLDKETIRRFFNKIEKLADNPEVGKPLRQPLFGLWELYFEKSFRIIYSIDFSTKTVIIEAIKHKDEF
ncbi:type II toxin-antitoxin system RelE/ParE family toxin [archaeon]|nr:type II toxin-antitoxin system RelE/ParE family toxin [archaeon]